MRKLIAVLGWVLFILIVGALFGAWPTQLLWNWLMPKFFGIARVTFWEAWGFVMLTGLLFRSSTSYKTNTNG